MENKFLNQNGLLYLWQKIKNMAPDKPTLRNLTAQMRLAITGKTNTPDLWAICQILGNDIVKARLSRW